jgi:two-component system OmpR family response regulator
MRRAGSRAKPAAAAAVTAAEASTCNVFAFENWRLDVTRRELRLQTGELVPLTAGQFELLSAFVRHPHHVLSRDQLIDFVKGREWAQFDRGIDTQVMRLRKKIEPEPGNPSLIKTVRGGGYVFAAAVTAV